MKLNTKTLRKIIKEELKGLLNEDLSNLNVRSIINVQDGESEQIPLMYDGELMEAYSPFALPLLSEYFGETVDETTIKKIMDLVDDDIGKFCLGSSGFQAQELLKTLDPKFKGFAIGHLIFDDTGDTYVDVQIGPNGLTVVEGQERIESNGELEVELGYGDTPSFDYDSIINPDHRMYDEYFGDMDTGSGGYGNQDVRGSVTVNINKIIEDVNSGKLGLDIGGQYEGNITYKVTQYSY